MTPKEKAIELVDKMYSLSPLQTIEFYSNSSMAKNCALIAVNEILNLYNDFIQTHEQFLYWQEVKQEILAL
jgi:hypothetical protein